jgi:hypothetical protein
MANTIDSWELEERYCDMLDECYPMVEFGELRYEPSRVLREVDPIAYRVGMNDYADMLISDGDIDGVEDEESWV